jgi:hypothetical protein
MLKTDKGIKTIFLALSEDGLLYPKIHLLAAETECKFLRIEMLHCLTKRQAKTWLKLFGKKIKLDHKLEYLFLLEEVWLCEILRNNERNVSSLSWRLKNDCWLMTRSMISQEAKMGVKIVEPPSITVVWDSKKRLV